MKAQVVTDDDDDVFVFTLVTCSNRYKNIINSDLLPETKGKCILAITTKHVK
jgi:hypothetical protein